MNNLTFPAAFPIMETDRLILREITHDDTQAIFSNFSDPEVAKWFFEQPLSEIEQASKFIDLFIDEFNNGTGLTWALELKNEGVCIGTCGYGEIELGSRGEVGFDLAKVQWGKGLMGEALLPVIEYGFERLKLQKIEAHSYSNNTRAIHLLEKVGFQMDKVSEDSHYYYISRGALKKPSPG